MTLKPHVYKREVQLIQNVLTFRLYQREAALWCMLQLARRLSVEFQPGMVSVWLLSGLCSFTSQSKDVHGGRAGSSSRFDTRCGCVALVGRDCDVTMSPDVVMSPFHLMFTWRQQGLICHCPQSVVTD